MQVPQKQFRILCVRRIPLFGWHVALPCLCLATGRQSVEYVLNVVDNEDAVYPVQNRSRGRRI